MPNFHTSSMDLDIQTSQRDAIPKREYIIIGLDLLEIRIRRIKSFIMNDDYYISIIDKIVSIKTELDNITYIPLAGNVKSCIAERL